jgi:glycosyltransferase involved in cell wall biosynthesis
MVPPKVSVVLPVWNGEQYLRQTLDSILGQDFPELEVVIVDDGSSDGTAQILSLYSGDTRIRLFRQTNKGLVAALNKGLELATAEFIARIDADDLMIPSRLTAQFSYLRENPDVLAVGSFIELIDGKGRKIGLRAFPAGKVKVTETMRRYCTLAHPAVMARKSALLAAGGYRECFRHAEDYDLWLRLIEMGPVDNIPEPLTKYRIHEKSVTHLHRVEQGLSTLAAQLAYRRRKAGLGDPFLTLTKAVTYDDIDALEIPAVDQSDFVVIRFALLSEESTDTTKLVSALAWSWTLRKYLHSGRYVRHCIVPATATLLKAGEYRLAFSWYANAMFTAPLSCCWMTLKLLITRSG